MKSLTKRNLLLVVLSLIVALCSLTFAATVKPAKAATAVNNITVMEAASVRVGLKENEYSGIRFRVILDEATKNNIVDNDNVQLGFIITPKYYFDKALEAKATAEAEDGSYDFLTEMKKDNPENFAEDKKHAYVGIAGEGLLMSNADEATKIYQYKGEWVASAAVENIKEANRNLQFTMIAYLKTDSTIEYFLPEDTTFSRAYLQTAHKSFMGGDVELDVIRGAQDTSFADYGTTDNPVKVSDNDDLYIISNAVAQGVTYEGATDNAVFELENDVEVDHDFEPIGDAFAGSFKESNKKVIVYNNKDLDSIGVDGVTVDNQTKLFNASERALDLYYNSSNADKDTLRHVAKENLPEYLADGTTKVEGTERVKSGAIVRETSNADNVKLTINYTADELLQFEKDGIYNAIRFTYLAVDLNAGTVITFRGSNTLFNMLVNNVAVGTDAETGRTELGRTSDYYFTKGMWRSHLINISDIVGAITDNQLYIAEIGTWASGTSPSCQFDFYIQDVELVKDTTTIFSTEIHTTGNNALFRANNYSPAKFTDTSVGSTGYYTTDTTTEPGVTIYQMLLQNSTVYGGFAYNSMMPTTYTDRSSVEQTIDHSGFVDGFGCDVGTRSIMYANCRFSIDEMKALQAQYGYEKIKVKCLYQAAAIANYTGASGTPYSVLRLCDGGNPFASGTKNDVNRNKWIEITISVDNFIKSMGTYSSDTERLELVDHTNATSGKVTQSLVQSQNTVCIGGDYRSGSAKLYIENISFVAPAE